MGTTNNIINKATSYAKAAHNGQVRKGGKDIPYITHPIAVGGILKENGFNVETQVAGILHDVVEDCPGYSLKDLSLEFGTNISTLVDYVSETDKSLSWKKRKELYIERLKVGPTEAVYVSAADKLHNLRCTYDDFEEHGGDVFTIFNSTPAGQFWYYDSLIEIFKKYSELDNISDELEMMISYIKSHAK